MKTVFLIITLINYFAFTKQQSLNCSKADERRVDIVFSKLITIGDATRKFPSNEVETQQYCSETRELVKSVENYNKQCLKEMPKQLTSILIYTIKNMANQICKPGSKRLPELLASAPCVNDADREMNKCILKTIDVFLGIQNADNKLKVPYVCCNANYLIDCSVDTLKKFDTCNEKHSETFRQFFHSLVGNILDLMCTEYSSSDKCSKLGAPPKKTKQQRRTKSIVSPLIAVFDSFPLL